MITAYDYPTARIISETAVDAILVGDSGGMNVLGFKDTLRVTMNHMRVFTEAVARATPRQLIIADMPFMSYELGNRDGLKNASSLIRAGAQAVKIEGGSEVRGLVRRLTEAGIPVVGHIGMTPQRYLIRGKYWTAGKEREAMMEDAKSLEEAGAFAIVLENTYAEVAEDITRNISIPTICIGSGLNCDGQVLVFHDVVGLSSQTPYFAKRYLDAFSLMRDAVSNYEKEVREGRFPSQEHWRRLKS